LSWLRFSNQACRSPAPTAAPPPKVTVSTPIVREVIEWDEYTGRMESTESVEVRARVHGYLQLIHFKDGQMVKKGDLLFVIINTAFQIFWPCLMPSGRCCKLKISWRKAKRRRLSSQFTSPRRQVARMS